MSVSGIRQVGRRPEQQPVDDAEHDGVGAAASFNQPIAVAVDRSGNVYVADRDNHTVRLIDPSGKVTVVAGTGAAGFAEGPATSAQFNQPYGVALSSDEKILYVADYLNHAIRALDLGTKRITTVAGNGKAGFANGHWQALRGSGRFHPTRRLGFDR